MLPKPVHSLKVNRPAPAGAALLWLGLAICGLVACSTAPERSAPERASRPGGAPLRVEPHARWSEAILYFAIVDRFADGDPANNAGVDRQAKGTFHGGDLRGLREHLDELAELGVTALWITPVVRNIDGFVTGAGFPDWGYHGYWADDFTGLDPRFGGEADLKALVDDCHARGIKVLLDVVYNHAGYESRMTADAATRGWFRTEGAGTCGTDDITSCVAGLPDLKTELPEVERYLLDAQLGWAARSGVDGFRLDTVKHVDHPFWQEHRRRTRTELGADFFLLGEVWGGDPQVLEEWFAPDEMDAGFDFSFQGSALSFVRGRGRAVAFDRYLKSREKVREGYLLAHFLSSHDVPGALFQLDGDRALVRLAAVLQFTSVGIPVIYYGEEVARPGGDWPDNRSDMPWGDRAIDPGAGLPRDEALRADYRRLIAIRRAHPALSRGLHSLLLAEGDVLVFEQRDETTGDVVVVAMNRGNAPATPTFPVPRDWTGAAIRDLWNQVDVPLTAQGIAPTLEARSARIMIASPTH